MVSETCFSDSFLEAVYDNSTEFHSRKTSFFSKTFLWGTFSSMFYLFSEEDVKDCMFNYNTYYSKILLDILSLLPYMQYSLCRFTVSMATPINTANSTPVIEHVGNLENQVNWADRELLYLQRGPLLANDRY